jgi:hypothetical protein
MYMCWNDFFFHFVKIDSLNNKSDMNLKTSQFGNGYKYKNKHVLRRMISPTTSLNTVLDLWITLYIGLHFHSMHLGHRRLAFWGRNLRQV